MTYEDESIGFQTNIMAEYSEHLDGVIEKKAITDKQKKNRKGLFSKFFKRKSKVYDRQSRLPTKEENKMNSIKDTEVSTPAQTTPINQPTYDNMQKEFPRVVEDVENMKSDLKALISEVKEISLNLNNIQEFIKKPVNVFQDPSKVGTVNNSKVNKGKDFKLTMNVKEKEVGNFISKLQDEFDISLDAIEIVEKTPEEIKPTGTPQ